MNKALKTIKNNKGFTLVELILVITILGILSVMAMPSFINITDKAHLAAIDGVLGSVREGVQLQKVKNILDGVDAYPTAAQMESGGGNTVFEGVLSEGVVADADLETVGWSSTGAGAYWYTFPNGTKWQWGYTQETGVIVRTL